MSRIRAHWKHSRVLVTQRYWEHRHYRTEPCHIVIPSNMCRSWCNCLTCLLRFRWTDNLNKSFECWRCVSKYPQNPLWGMHERILAEYSAPTCDWTAKRRMTSCVVTLFAAMTTPHCSNLPESRYRRFSNVKFSHGNNVAVPIIEPVNQSCWDAALMGIDVDALISAQTASGT